MNRNWKYNFENKIISRGVNYFEMGAVKNLEISDKEIHAIVEGAEDYEVDIYLNKGEITELICTCPYAEDGNHCKHMVATLMAADDAKRKSKLIKPFTLVNYIEDDNIVPLEILLNKTNKEDLVEFVLELATDATIEAKAKMKFTTTFTGRDIEQFKRRIDSIFSNWEDNNNYYYDEYDDEDYGERYYDNFYDIRSTIDDFFEEVIEEMIKKKCYLEVFDVTMYLFIKLVGYEETYVFEPIAQKCYGTWEKIVEYCDKKRIRKFFEYYLEPGSIDEPYDSYLTEFILNELMSEYKLKESMADLDKTIESISDFQKTYSAISMNGEPITLVEKRIHIMQKLKMSEQEIANYIKSKWYLRDMREYMANQAEKAENYEEMIRILRESRELDGTNSSLWEKDTKRIIDACQKFGDKTSEKEERIKALNMLDKQGIVEFRVIKGLCSKEEWKAIRKDLIPTMNYVYDRAQAYLDEGLIAELTDCVLGSNDFFLLDAYGRKLPKGCADRILKKYSYYVDNLAREAKTRNKYNELIKYLRKMCKYKNGNVVVERLAKKWIEQYPTKKLLVSELSEFIGK